MLVQSSKWHFLPQSASLPKRFATLRVSPPISVSMSFWRYVCVYVCAWPAIIDCLTDRPPTGTSALALPWRRNKSDSVAKVVLQADSLHPMLQHSAVMRIIFKQRFLAGLFVCLLIYCCWRCCKCKKYLAVARLGAIIFAFD